MSGKTANVPGGPAIEVRENCSLRCEDCTLVGAIGLRADGNGTTELVGGSIEATETALVVGGNARVELSDNRIEAPVGVVGGANGKVSIRGGALTGKRFAITLSSNAKVSVGPGAKVTGPLKPGRKGSIEGLER